MPDHKILPEDSTFQHDVDELVALTEKALKFVEKRDLSRAFLVTDKRKRILSRMKFKNAHGPDMNSVQEKLNTVCAVDASIRSVVEAELAEVLKRISAVKKRLQLENRFVGRCKKVRKIIDGKL